MGSRSPEQLLRDMSATLGLKYSAQDWGIVNADGARLDEFSLFFEQESLDACQRFELAELILASANERLVESLGLDAAMLQRLVGEHPQAFSHQVAYWSGLDDEAEFPLAAVLSPAAL